MKSIGHEIRVENAVKKYGELAALNNFSLDIKAGKFTVLLGPSGSGKSTLIRSIAGIEKLDSGSIYLGDREVNRGPINVPPEKRDLAMVFQDYALWPHLTAYENVAYALKRRKIDGSAISGRTHEMLERVGLGSKGDNYPHQLSGGEQQRVALARAIVAEPALLLFDEPLSNLDADLRERLRIEISTLTRESGATALYITHDQSEAFALADKIGVLRSGKLEQYATPEKIYHNPATPFVARFTGLGGQLAGVVEKYSNGVADVMVGEHHLKARSERSLKKNELVDIMLRPTATTLSHAHGKISRRIGTLPGTVIDTAYRGRGYEHLVRTPYGEIASIFDIDHLPRGTNVILTIDSGAAMAFSQEIPNEKVE